MFTRKGAIRAGKTKGIVVKQKYTHDKVVFDKRRTKDYNDNTNKGVYNNSQEIMT